MLERNGDVLMPFFPTYYMDDHGEMELLPTIIDKTMRSGAVVAHGRGWKRPTTQHSTTRSSSSFFFSSSRRSSATSTSIYKTTNIKKMQNFVNEKTLLLNAEKCWIMTTHLGPESEISIAHCRVSILSFSFLIFFTNFGRFIAGGT
jgi:hypothetical protein